MDTSIIYLGAGDNMSEEDKRDRLYTIGFIVVIIIIFVILAIVIGGSYSQNFKSVQIAKPVIPTLTQQESVRSASASTSQLLPVRTKTVPTNEVIPTATIAPTSTPTPTVKPTSSPTNTPTPTPTVTPTPTNTPAPTPTITPTPGPTQT